MESEARHRNAQGDDKELVLPLLRCYPRLLELRDSCPLPITTGVRYHINTGDTAPISQRRFCNSAQGSTVIVEQVAAILQDGVIEEGSGAWGFPVVLV